MNRRVRTRLLALVASLAYLTSPGAVFGGVACPHHAGLAPASAPEQHHGHEHHDHAGHHAGDDADAADHAPDHDHHGDCTCIGSCAPSSALVLAEPAAHCTPVAAVTPDAQLLHAGAAAPPRAHTPYLLPWSIAPPAVLIG